MTRRPRTVAVAAALLLAACERYGPPERAVIVAVQCHNRCETAVEFADGTRWGRVGVYGSVGDSLTAQRMLTSGRWR